MTFQLSPTNLHVFGLDFPVIIWPLWFIVAAFLVFGRAPGRINWWRSGLVRRKKDPVAYWIGITPFVVLALGATAMFNQHVFR
jgi:hypothetical protein